MRLTIWNRIKICLEVLTIQRGHKHFVLEKELPIFQRGYDAGRRDGRYESHFDINGGGLCKECEGITVTECMNCGIKY